MEEAKEGHASILKGVKEGAQQAGHKVSEAIHEIKEKATKAFKNE